MSGKKAVIGTLKAGGFASLLLFLFFGGHGGLVGGKPPLVRWLRSVWLWITGQQDKE